MKILCFKLDKVLGKSLFFFTYVFIFAQIFVINNIEEGPKLKNKTLLFIVRTFAHIFIFIASVCHLQASFADPGKINHKNNVEYLDFYSSTRSSASKRAELFNKNSRHLIRPPGEETEEEVASDCEYDETIYEDSPFFDEDKINKMKQEFSFELTQCKKCKVCRMPGAHHCATCQGCIYGMDHHCPWMNNCIGQFNQKFFIQYCIYSIIYNLLCGFISIYYVVYKQPHVMIHDIRFTLLIIFQLVLSASSVILLCRILLDQYEAIYDSMNNYDFKLNKMIEKRNLNEVLSEIFGSTAKLNWILPLNVGGYLDKFKTIKYD